MLKIGKALVERVCYKRESNLRRETLGEEVNLKERGKNESVCVSHVGVDQLV